MYIQRHHRSCLLRPCLVSLPSMACMQSSVHIKACASTLCIGHGVSIEFDFYKVTGAQRGLPCRPSLIGLQQRQRRRQQNQQQCSALPPAAQTALSELAVGRHAQTVSDVSEGLETPVQLIYLLTLLGFLVVGAYLVVRQVGGSPVLDVVCRLWRRLVNLQSTSSFTHLLCYCCS